MRNRAEWHQRAGECAEAGHQMDYAAHEYFQASACFAEEGKRREAIEMRRREQFALSKTTRLLDSARSLSAQGQSLAARAAVTARQDTSDRNEASAELYVLAAGLYEESANRFVALGAKFGGDCAEFLLEAAENLERACTTLVQAAIHDLFNAKRNGMRRLYQKAERLRDEAARRNSEICIQDIFLESEQHLDLAVYAVAQSQPRNNSHAQFLPDLSQPPAANSDDSL